MAQVEKQSIKRDSVDTDADNPSTVRATKIESRDRHFSGEAPPTPRDFPVIFVIITRTFCRALALFATHAYQRIPKGTVLTAIHQARGCYSGSLEDPTRLMPGR